LFQLFDLLRQRRKEHEGTFVHPGTDGYMLVGLSLLIVTLSLQTGEPAHSKSDDTNRHRYEVIQRGQAMPIRVQFGK
jgi:hypothetical protein